MVRFTRSLYDLLLAMEAALAITHLARATSASALVLSLEARSVQDLSTLIASSPLFANIPFADCVRVAHHARRRTFSRTELIFQQGEGVRRVSIIESGLVKLTQLSPDGTEVILWLRGRAQAVGIPNDPTHPWHTCSARPLTNCQTASWDWFWLDQLASAGQIRINVNHLVSQQLGEIEERFREIATEKVGIRVALTLARVLKQVGKPASGGIEVKLSREALAQLTGTTLFTVSRLISRWNEQGLVEARREAIIVSDPVRLLSSCRDLAEHAAHEQHD